MESAALTYGQPIYVIHYTRLYANGDGRNEIGPSRVVGTELMYLEARGAYYRVRTPEGTEGWVWSARVAHVDPRCFFTVRGHELRGYLVSNMYEDYSGGSATQLILRETPLGDVHLETRNVSAMVLGAGSVAEVHTDSGQRYSGRLLRTWLVAPGVMFHLEKASSVALDRVR